jgi:hypothetical protein
MHEWNDNPKLHALLERDVDAAMTILRDLPAPPVRPAALQAWQAAAVVEARQYRPNSLRRLLISGGLATAAVCGWLMVSAPRIQQSVAGPKEIANVETQLEDWSESMDESTQRIAFVLDPYEFESANRDPAAELDDWIHSFEQLEDLGG